MLTDTDTYLGAATVAEIEGDRIRITIPDGSVWARAALAYPYRPTPGDVVLAIGKEDYFIIGVLTGRGETVLEVPGKLRLRAGQVEIVGEEGIQLRSPSITLKTGKLRTIARLALEKFGDSYRWVKGALRTRAGRARTEVKSTYRVTADRIVERAAGDVKIDGRQIKLG